MAEVGAEDETQTANVKAILEDIVHLKESGQTLVPVRSFYGYFGSDIKWDSHNACTVVNYEDKDIRISNLSNEIVVNGVNHTSAAPAKCIDGTMYIELASAANSIGYEANLIENTNTIIATRENLTAEQLENFKQVANNRVVEEEPEPEPVEEEVIEPKVTYTETGNASWYGGAHHGRKTASGERFNKNAFTAAHKTLPFGTVVKVTSLNNGKSVDVRITDRGPFSRGRIIDLSMASADAIGLKSAGVGPVKVEIIK